MRWSCCLVAVIALAGGGCAEPVAEPAAAESPGPVVAPVVQAAPTPEPSAAKEPPLVCILRGEPTCELGKAPDVAVEIVNHTGKDIYLVGSLDASDCKWRYPHCYFEVVGPDGKPIAWGSARCGNVNALRQQDFVKVPSGGTFNPYQRIDEYGFFASDQISAGWFRTVGEYRIRFVYSTDSERLTDWLGNRGQVGDKEAKAVVEQFGDLIRQVPQVKVMSNELKVTVVDAAKIPPSERSTEQYMQGTRSAASSLLKNLDKFALRLEYHGSSLHDSRCVYLGVQPTPAILPATFLKGRISREEAAAIVGHFATSGFLHRGSINRCKLLVTHKEPYYTLYVSEDDNEAYFEHIPWTTEPYVWHGMMCPPLHQQMDALRTVVVGEAAKTLDEFRKHLGNSPPGAANLKSADPATSKTEMPVKH